MNGARYRYLETICELVKQGEDIVLVSSDYAAPSLDLFREEYPDRYVSVGIAEQNLIQIASGLGLAGKRVVAYGMAPFPCIRAFDQIKNTVSMMKLPIHILSAGVGFAIPEFGATHYCAEDISLIRTLPNIKILTITDEVMARKAARYVLESKKPCYIRMDKYSEGELYQAERIDFEKGFEVLKKGHDIAVITNGYYTKRIAALQNYAAQCGASIKIIDLYAIPFQKDKLLGELENVKGIITIEEHVLEGGIGSIILELLSDAQRYKPVRRIGIDFQGHYPEIYGSREYFMNQYGLADEDIIKKIQKFWDKIGKE